MENPLKELINVFKTGTLQEVKEARKKIEKFWHQDYISNKKENGPKFKIFIDEIENFKSWDDKHKPYFIYSLKWVMLSIGEEYFDEIARFLLMYIQHPLGTVRQAVLKAAEYWVCEIDTVMNFDEKNIVDPAWQKKNLENIKRFYSFVRAAERLLAEYREPRFNRYKYVRSFPPSVYKSLQILLTEKIFYSERMEKLYEMCENKMFGPDHGNKL